MKLSRIVPAICVDGCRRRVKRLYDLAHIAGNIAESVYPSIYACILRLYEHLNLLEDLPTPQRVLQYNRYGHYAFLFFLPFALSATRWYAIPITCAIASFIASFMTLPEHAANRSYCSSSMIRQIIHDDLSGLPSLADQQVCQNMYCISPITPHFG